MQTTGVKIMSIIARKELEKEQRRKDILDAAEKLFFSKGYDNVSLNEIAKEVKLGRSTLYLYFENKEELFFAIVLRGAQILHRIVLRESKKAKTSYEKLAAFRDAYYEFSKEYHEFSTKIFGAYLHHSPNTKKSSISNDSVIKFYSEYKKYFGILHPIWYYNIKGEELKEDYFNTGIKETNVPKYSIRKRENKALLI